MKRKPKELEGGERMLGTVETAKRLGITIRTLRQDRRVGGPTSVIQHVRIGRFVYYSEKSLNAYISALMEGSIKPKPRDWERGNKIPA